MSAALERAIACLDAHDLPGGMDALLAEWREERSAAVADRIDRLDVVLRPVIPPLQGKTAAARHTDWLHIAGAARAVDQSALAAGLAEPPMTRITARLDWLMAQPGDPRWTRPLAELFIGQWNRGTQGSARLGNRAQKVLRRLGDIRTFDFLRGQRARRSNYWGSPLSGVLERLGTVIGAPPPAPDDAILSRLDAALARVEDRPPPTLESLRRPQRGEAEMQAMVHDDPHDVDTRRIYADWLEQTASPRAEFLRLQLKAYDGRALKKDRARIEKLIAQHGLSWLGAIAPHVQDVDWHLGFPSGADVKFRGRRQRDAALQLPGWQTLTEATTRDPIVTAHPALANVRQLGRTSPLIGTANRVTPQPVSAIDTPTPLPITDLVIDADDVALVDFAHLPALRRLNIRHRNSRIVDPMDFKGYIEALTPLHLERLTTWHINAELWLSLRQVLPHVHRFEVAAPWSFRFGVEQRADGLHLDIVWPWPESNRSFHTPRQVALALEPDRVTIHTPGYNHRAERLQRWAKALRPAEVTLPKARRVRRS